MVLDNHMVIAYIWCLNMHMVQPYLYGAPPYVYGGTICICVTICLWLSSCTPASALMCRAMYGIRILSCAICVLDPQGANMYIVTINLDKICILSQACNHIYMVAQSMYLFVEHGADTYGDLVVLAIDIHIRR